MLGLFVAVEARAKAPLMPLRVFRSRAVSAANVTMVVCGSASFCDMVLHDACTRRTSWDTRRCRRALALIPSSLSVIVGSKLAPRLMPKAGATNVAVIGALVAATGFGWQSTMTADGTYLTSILGPGILMMIGVGLAATPLASLATAGAGPGEAGLVSGLINTSRTMGGALGLAVLSTVAAARTAGGTSPAELAAGYALAFRTGAGILLVAAALMLVWLPRRVAEP